MSIVKVIQTGPLLVNSLVVSLCKNKVFVVDPACCMFSADEKKISSYLEQNKLDLLAIVLTHGHFDHVAGLPSLKRMYPDVPILIHKADSFMIGNSSASIQAKQLSYIGFSDFIPYVSSLPNFDFELEDEKNLFECLGEFSKSLEDKELKNALFSWKILHTPGHTMGSVCLYNAKEKILISGDTVFYQSWGRTDLGGSEELILKSLARLKKLVEPETTVYPGHDYFGFKMKENYF